MTSKPVQFTPDEARGGIQFHLKDFAMVLLTLLSVFGSFSWGYGVQQEKIRTLEAAHIDERAALSRLGDKIEALDNTVAALTAVLNQEIAEKKRKNAR
jgi:hypothetical protein